MTQDHETDEGAPHGNNGGERADDIDRAEKTVVDLGAPAGDDDEDEDEAAPGWSASGARASDEQPIVLVDSGTFPPPRGALGSTSDAAAEAPAAGWPSADDLESDPLLPPPELPGQPGAEAEAWADLEIRTPPDELAAFARARLEALVRTGQPERAARLDAAAQLALAAVRRAMGAAPREDA